MKIIVDTNIVFSAILNSSSTIGKVLMQSKKHFQFYTCDFLRVELVKHKKKLLSLTKLSEDELFELENLVTENISFINESLIPTKTIIAAESLLKNIDIKDTPFVALAVHLDATLWTGDSKLITGLKRKKFYNVASTSELVIIYDNIGIE
jgi:predicted nucleic acid-binding protein